MAFRGQMARRQPDRFWPRSARGARQALRTWLFGGAMVLGGPVSAQMGETDIGHWSPSSADTILSAEFTGPTARYAHAVLGDGLEWGGLTLTFAGHNGTAMSLEIQLPQDHVFEDLQPRLVDLTLDGRANAVMVVETDMARGAALALYGVGGKIAETPHIGQRNRWLAPIGAADLDGDGKVELAYIDRPHLAKTLRIWRFEGDELAEIASLPGLTNHRIGEDFITSGMRDCGEGPEIITVDATWSRVVASRLAQTAVEARDIGPFSGPEAVAKALNCS
ncbi:VCBS repeat-containing protein [Phycobacter sp. 'Weihai']